MKETKVEEYRRMKARCDELEGKQLTAAEKADYDYIPIRIPKLIAGMTDAEKIEVGLLVPQEPEPAWKRWLQPRPAIEGVGR